MRIAVMQPYFYPYLGYFRLFTESDIFVALDCVQFPRRGWVHRNRFTSNTGEAKWLTLSLEKAPRETNIAEMQFREDSRKDLQIQLRRLVIKDRIMENLELSQVLLDTAGDLSSYAIRNIHFMLEALSIKTPIIHCKDLNLSPELSGVSRIIESVKKLGGTEYINLSGGALLYDRRDFSNHGIDLRILDEFQGPKLSSLEILLINGKKACQDLISK